MFATCVLLRCLWLRSTLWFCIGSRRMSCVQFIVMDHVVVAITWLLRSRGCCDLWIFQPLSYAWDTVWTFVLGTSSSATASKFIVMVVVICDVWFVICFNSGIDLHRGLRGLRVASWMSRSHMLWIVNVLQSGIDLWIMICEFVDVWNRNLICQCEQQQ